MPVTKILARDFLFHVNTGTDETPVWTLIRGLNTWSPSATKNDADTTSYEDEGWTSHLPASRGKSVTLSGFTMEDQDTGARDPGQAACEAWSDGIGPDGLRLFRITSPGGTTTTGLASASVNPGGGGTDDPSAWELSVTFSGKPEIEEPAA